MTREQYRKANGVVYPIIMVILGYLALSLIAFAVFNAKEANWKTWLQLGASVVGIVGATVGFLTQREKKAGAVTILFSATVAYVVVCLVNTTPGTYVYAFPILFASMTYLNIRIMVIGNTIVVVSNVVRLLINLKVADDSLLSASVVAIFTVTLAAVASIKVAQLLIKFNKENMEAIEEAAEKQRENSKSMAIVAENIIKHFDAAMGMLNNLKGSIDTCNFAMSNIVESTESTAEAIQKQAEMCADIQTNTDIAEKGTKSMIEASRRTDETVDEGAAVVRELKEQAKNVEDASSIP